MNRDMDLIRDMLKTVAKSRGSVDGRTFTSDNIDFQKAAYHIDIMKQAGLIEASVAKEWGGSYVNASILSLTWDGNDFLSAVSSDSTWSKVKRIIAENTGDVPLEVMKSLAIEIVRRTLFY